MQPSVLLWKRFVVKIPEKYFEKSLFISCRLQAQIKYFEYVTEKVVGTDFLSMFQRF